MLGSLYDEGCVCALCGVLLVTPAALDLLQLRLASATAMRQAMRMRSGWKVIHF
jgi:hypothetical protein